MTLLPDHIELGRPRLLVQPDATVASPSDVHAHRGQATEAPVLPGSPTRPRGRGINRDGRRVGHRGPPRSPPPSGALSSGGSACQRPPANEPRNFGRALTASPLARLRLDETLWTHTSASVWTLSSRRRFGPVSLSLSSAAVVHGHRTPEDDTSTGLGDRAHRRGPLAEGPTQRRPVGGFPRRGRGHLGHRPAHNRRRPGPDRGRGRQMVNAAGHAVPTPLAEVIMFGRTLKERATDSSPTSNGPTEASGGLVAPGPW